MPEDEKVITKASKRGREYKSLKTPCSVSLEVVSHSKSEELSEYGGFPVHHLYVKCNQIKENLLPLEANPREPSRSPQVRSMEKTLLNNPKDFVKKNNGMTILCQDVSEGGKQEVELVFDEGREGVCNGAHTYFAIYQTDFESDDAIVLIEAIEIPEDLQGDDRHHEMVEIARARNSNTSLEQKSEADFLGFYEHFKQVLNDERVISWHEGDSEAYEDSIDAPHFLRMLYSVDPREFYHPLYNESSGTHKRAVTSRSKLHNKWFNQMKRHQLGKRERKPQEYMVPLIPDILEVRDMLSYSLAKDDFEIGLRKSSLYQDYIQGEDGENLKELEFGKYKGKEGFDIPDQLEIMLLGLFRTNVYIYPSQQGKSEISGWIKDPEDLWEKRKDKVMGRMIEYFNDAGKEPREFPRRSAPYENNLFSYGFDPQIEKIKPEIIYDIGSRTRFRKSSSNPTHLLKLDGKGLVDLSKVSSSSEGISYKISEKDER